MSTPDAGRARRRARSIRPATLAIGVYAWVATAAFGMTTLDVMYARLVPASAAASPEVADVLLLVVGLTLVSGMLACVAASTSPRARPWLVSSVVLAALGLLAMPLLAASLAGTDPGAGAPIRLLNAGAVSVLAVSALAVDRGHG
jgi:hypothetical protein